MILFCSSMNTISKFPSLCLLVCYQLVAIINFNNGVEASHRVYPDFQSLSAVSGVTLVNFSYEAMADVYNQQMGIIDWASRSIAIYIYIYAV
ncbi:hypothetical protein QQP08_015659 [Theobroma cacao]|nr:hypothetical protein QQP08_015659 [Theobroma cacao]